MWRKPARGGSFGHGGAAGAGAAATPPGQSALHAYTIIPWGHNYRIDSCGGNRSDPYVVCKLNLL